MSRFRARNEVMAEIFGPERLRKYSGRVISDTTEDIPPKESDVWSGFGPSSETLEAKVLSLETSNDELEAKFEAEIEAFKKRLREAGSEA